MRSYEQLQLQTRPTANILREHPETTFKVWMNHIKKEMEVGDLLYNQGKIDDSYLKYFFAVQMLLEVLPKHKEFAAGDNQYQQLRSRVGIMVTKLEQIKLKLKGSEKDEAAMSDSANQKDTRTHSLTNASTSQEFSTAVSNRFPSLSSRGGSSGPISNHEKTPTSSSPQLSGISAVEIQTLLANSTPKILFIDIRPMEEFIQGHLSWRSPQTAPIAGLINIEPDWLKAGVTSEDLGQYLTSFGSSSTTAKLLFDARMNMDLIVFYDNDSRGMKPGSVFDYLYNALYSDIMTAPKVAPKILSGGYIAWNYFIANSQNLANLDWVEIGEGNGIKPLARSASSEPLPSSGGVGNFNLSTMRANHQQQMSFNQPGSANPVTSYPKYYGVTPSQNASSIDENLHKSSSGSSLNFSNQSHQNVNVANTVTPSYQTGNGGGGYFQQAPSQNTIAGLGLSQNNIMYSNQQQSSALYQNGNSSNQQISAQNYSSQQGIKMTIPERSSSLAGDSQDGRNSITRRTLFNDPFLGKVGGLAGSGPQVNSSSANAGLAAPLISLPLLSQPQQKPQNLPSHGSGSVYNAYQNQQTSSKLSSLSFNDADLPISYPRASSRSPSPELDPQSKEQFSARYPSMETLDKKLSPPSVPSKSYSSSTSTPSYQKPSAPSQSNQRFGAPSIQQSPPAVKLRPTVPALPPKPMGSLGAGVKGMSLEDLNSTESSRAPNNIPNLPPKPTKLSPSLPPKPGKIETVGGLDKRVLIRGQHPFILPTSPIGHKFGISGLRNLGNTCFMNSILQCLSATYPFSRYFMDGSYRRHLAKNNPLSSKGKVSEGFAHVVRDLWAAEESVVVPSQFKQVIGSIHPNFAGNEQQDSQEFLSFLLDQLHEDLNVAKRPFPPNGPDLDSENYGEQEFMMMEWQNYRARNWSIIVDMFQGMLRSVLQCLTCGKTSTTYNMFMYLTLPIPSRNKDGVKNGPVTIFECLEAFLATEKLSGDDQWKCPRCKVNRDASKILSIVRLPTVLLIHFKRFSYQGPFRDKLETAIYYPAKRLDMSKYTKMGGDNYSLCGVSNHFGGLNGGHYTAQVKHVHNDRWFSLDDSRVSEANESDVQSSSAYILFYLSNQNKMGDWWNGTPL